MVQFHRRLQRSQKKRPIGSSEMLDEARRRMGISLPVQLIETRAVSSPVLYGLLRLQILLPMGFVDRFNREELGYVLYHELAHVKRHDLWGNWLVTLLQIVYWFNPLVWLAFSRMRSDRELACDELALTKAEADSAPAYGRTIIKLLESFSCPSAMTGLVGILEDKQQMKRRIQMIAKFKSPGRWSALAVIAIGCLGLVTLTDGQSTADQSSDGSSEDFTKLDLTPYYDTGERSDFDNHDNGWRTFPKGDQVFQGVPFSARGMVMLSGKSLAAIKNFPLQKSIDKVPVNRKFEKLFMLQGAAFRTEQGTVLANVRLDYTDGTWSLLPIAYGEQTADLWRSNFERPVELASNSRLGWVAIPPAVVGGGLSTRVFLTSFTNPHPEREVSSVTVQSTEAKASVIVVGMTVGRALTTEELAAIPDLVDPQEPTDSTLKIKVVVGESMSPAGGVRLAVKGFYHRFDANLGEFTANPDGVTEINYSSEMNWMSVEVIDNRYVAKSVRWDIDQGAKIPEQFTLRLQPSLQIGGIVEDEQGHPVAGADISLNVVTQSSPDLNSRASVSRFAQATTDGSGRWHSGAFPTDTKTIAIHVLQKDFAPARFVADAETSAPDGIKIPLADLVTGVARFKLSGGATIAGTVVDLSSRPISDATITLEETAYSANKKTVATDTGGGFKIEGVQNGKQLVAVRAEGFAPDFVWRDVGTDEGEIHFQLKPGHIYKGRITQPNGTPVGGAYVSVQSWNGMQHLDETVGTTPEGYYAFGSLPDSGLVFRVWRAGYVSSTGLVPSSTSDHNDFVLQPIMGVVGNVTDFQTGEPIKSFQVIPGQNYQGIAGVRWQDYGIISGENGEFKFEPTDANASFVLKVSADGYLPQVTPSFAIKDLPKSFAIRMVRGEGPRGVVVSANGQPVPGVEVAFLAEGLTLPILRTGFSNFGNQSAQHMTTDVEGRFKFGPELNGQLLVAIGAAGYGEVSFDPATEDYRVVLRPLGSITGEVKLPGVELSGTAVLVGASSPEPAGGLGLMFDFNEFKAPVGEDGKFTITGVPPGKRKLIWLRPIGNGGWSHALSRDVEIKAGEVTRYTMEAPGRIVKGRAVLSDPTKAVRWQFGFLRTPPPKPPGQFKSQAEAEVWFKSPEMQEYQKNAQTYSLYFEADGSFSTIPVEPGTYKLTLSANDPNTGNQSGIGGRELGYLSRDIVVPEGNTSFDLGDLEVPVRVQLRVGMAAPDFTAIDAERKPFSLENFRGRRVLVQIGDLGKFENAATDLKSGTEKLLSVMRRATAENRASIIVLTEPESFQQAVKTVVEDQLPFVLGTMEKDKLHKLLGIYSSSGQVIIGPDGNIEQLLPFGFPEQRAAQLEAALLK